jgi:RNA polymerase sigma-70 factor, ECF subfamily
MIGPSDHTVGLAQSHREGIASMNAKSLLSDESTVSLIEKARMGDRDALEALLQRSLPELKRWAHGKLPPQARGALDTGDVVQETVLHVLRRLDSFEPRHVHSMQQYLRRAVINRVRDELRRIGRQPPPQELVWEPASKALSALEVAIRTEEYQAYRTALAALSAKDRQLIVMRIELQWSYIQIASTLGMSTPDAARVAIFRALRRLSLGIRRSA